MTNGSTGQLYEFSVTEPGGPNASVLAEVGYGTFGSDPRIDNSWVWAPTMYAGQAGNNDVYVGQFVAPIYNSVYSYTFRFSIDNGASYTAADRDGWARRRAARKMIHSPLGN